VEEKVVSEFKDRRIEALVRKRRGKELAKGPKSSRNEPNETIEAYTGNHVARKGDRNPPRLVKRTASIESESESSRNADGDGVNGPEANTESARKW
jgi:hypothetical protein